MTDALQLQVAVAATPGDAFRALTDSAALAAWFAERADVSLPARRYDFWGRFTPEAPDREAGRRPLLAAARGERLSYGWRVRGAETTVAIDLAERDGRTLVVVRHQGAPRGHDPGSYTLEDFWFLALENLRRHLDGGRAPVRCDFSAPMTGDIRHTVDRDGVPGEVFGALIRPEQLERWIASRATVEPVVGGRYDLGWGAAGPVKILDLAPGERLAYSWEGETGQPETVVTWTLEGSGGGTQLTIVHSGFAPDAPTGGYNAGWLNFLSWIRSLVEDGPGWAPPTPATAPGQERFYPAAIARAQGELVHAGGW